MYMSHQGLASCEGSVHKLTMGLCFDGRKYSRAYFIFIPA